MNLNLEIVLFIFSFWLGAFLMNFQYNLAEKRNPDLCYMKFWRAYFFVWYVTFDELIKFIKKLGR